MSKDFWSIQVIISCAFSRVWSQEQEWRWKGEWRKSGEKCGFKLASRGDSIWRENCDSDAKLRRALIYFVVKPILVSHCVPWPPGALIRLFLWNWNSLGPGLDSLLRIHWFQTFTAASHFSFQSHHVAKAGPGIWKFILRNILCTLISVTHGKYKIANELCQLQFDWIWKEGASLLLEHCA